MFRVWGWRGRHLTRLLTLEFHPQWARYFHWVRRPVTVLLLAAWAATVCGWSIHPNAYALAAGLVVVIALGLVWPWLTLAGLQGTVRFGQPRAREGETVSITLTVQNRWPISSWGLAVRGLEAGTGDEEVRPGLTRAAGWRSTRATWDWEAPVRGVYPRGGSALVSSFPFGVRESSRPLEVATRLVVWPRTFRVGPIPEGAIGDSAEGPSRRDRPGPSGDLLGVRPYRRGDPVRRIHWAQTARHDHPIVCELHAHAQARVQLILDIDAQSHVGDPINGSFAWAVRVVASLAEGWLGQGASVALVLGDRVVGDLASSIVRRREVILDALAVVVPDATWSLTRVLDGPACRGPVDGLRIVVTTDLALDRQDAGPRRQVGERLVVLRSSGFGGGPTPTPLAARSWIVVDGPATAPTCLLQGVKEAIRVG